MLFVLSLLFIGIALAHGYFYSCALQLKNYRNREIFSVVTKSMTIDAAALCVNALACFICYAFVSLDYYAAFYFVLLLPSLAAVVVKAVVFKKVNVDFTRRMKTIAVTYGILVLVLSALLTVFVPTALGGVACLTLPLLIAANSFTLPFFKNKNKRYLDAAKEKLKRVNPLIIAVTGSGGKTTVKNMLSVLLAEKGKTYATPKSYNTPLGIATSVSAMDEDVKIFVAEFGARKTGDIKELVDLFKPNIGVLTSIAAQHVETFGSIENVAKEKLSLIQATEKAFVSSSVDYDLPPNAIKVKEENIRIKRLDVYGTAFDYIFDGETFEVETELLGLNNVYNLALAITVAISLGVSAEYVRQSIPLVKPVPHRLEGMTSSGLRIIDDGYNVNPSGAEDAVRLLATYPGRKIVTTSGFVETDDKENEKFARFLSQKVDVVIILGLKNRRALLAGLDGVEYHCVGDMEECKKLYADILMKGDALLITANLPEEYCM
ncbi:MAG: UDP-N-acetylmuramoyl-tripeptide--D-alanyl-D-alanine ligase [Clostridia bacterium]|nr:UDP-N-acetylmuramoyl-tripeptide--D-alanyl-D-alanine ligase [Clostridia bacterium]